MMEINIYPIVIIVFAIMITIIILQTLFLTFGDKKDKRHDEFNSLVENNRYDIIKKYSDSNGKLDVERVVVELAIQNEIIMSSIEKLNKLFNP